MFGLGNNCGVLPFADVINPLYTKCKELVIKNNI